MLKVRKSKKETWSKLDTSADEFLRSRNRQEQQAQIAKDKATRRMLLFYAVECGGKYQLLKKNSLFMFSKLPENLRNVNHGIPQLLKEIGIETKIEFPILKSRHDQDVHPNHYQEVWRYGIDYKDENDQIGKAIEEELKRILERLHEIEGRK